MNTRFGSYVLALALVVSYVTISVPDAVAVDSTPFTAVADSYVDASRPTRNYGTKPFLRVDNSPVRIAYLTFDVQSVGVSDSALLRITALSNHGSGFDVQTVDGSWNETEINASNAPSLGPIIGSSGSLTSGQAVDVDVSSAVTGDGLITIAITTTSSTAMKLASRESSTPPVLFVPAPLVGSHFVIERSGTVYSAVSQTTPTTFTGSLKTVVESAVSELGRGGGGTITFLTGVYDLGSDWFEFYDVTDVVFEGQGIDVTILQNNSSAATDTEPFDFTNSKRLTIRDMTVFAGGPARSTSDALDFDRGDDVVVERVKITGSRGRGIVFDGKDLSGTMTADRNVIRDCVIVGTPSDGIELLASSFNTVTGCTITDVGGHGIQVTKSSTLADQPNKKSNDNTISGNIIDNSGQNGIDINSSDRNVIYGNFITNSSDDTAGRDGIRIASNNDITCDANEVDGNTATDNQASKTQKYGLNINSALCSNNEVGSNDFTGNLVADINDLGTNTLYTSTDTEPPTAPGNLTAPTVEWNQVDLSWDAASDNVAVTGYTVLRNGADIGSVGGSTLFLSDASVGPGTTYSYTVVASDGAGNTSLESNVVVITTPDPPASLALYPIADAYVDSSNPTRNYGSSAQLRIDGSPERRAYIAFDLQGLAGPVTQATLRIYANSSASVGHVVSTSVSTWSESTITFADAPAVGSALGSSGPFSAGTWLELDVTSYVAAGGVYSFVLTTPHTTAISYGSRESATPPELIIATGP